MNAKKRMVKHFLSSRLQANIFMWYSNGLHTERQKVFWYQKLEGWIADKDKTAILFGIDYDFVISISSNDLLI